MKKKINTISLDSLTDEIRMLYRSDLSKGEKLIEDHVALLFNDYLPSERVDSLEKLVCQFKSHRPENNQEIITKSKQYSEMFSVLLGKKIPADDLSSHELLEKLAISLNTVFDTVNRIISVIHTTLLGKNTELETIRHIIGSHLDNTSGHDSLQNYLNQIEKAFLVAHKAFQEAAAKKIIQIMEELDPDHLSAMTKGGLNFGPLKKAAIFDIYNKKFKTFKTWFESGRLMEELLREFEKNCHKLYKIDAGGI